LLRVPANSLVDMSDLTFDRIKAGQDLNAPPEDVVPGLKQVVVPADTVLIPIEGLFENLSRRNALLEQSADRLTNVTVEDSELPSEVDGLITDSADGDTRT